MLWQRSDLPVHDGALSKSQGLVGPGAACASTDKSQHLSTWIFQEWQRYQLQPTLPFLSPLFDVANDKRISPGTNLTVEQMQNIDAATDISNSDMDWSDDGKGGVYISYGWSNQNSFANMFLAAAEVRNATQRQWLESFFER